MLISHNWLKKFSKIDRTPAEVADKITLALTEVENIKKTGRDFIFEIENKGLTHRPDCFSHLGIAREVSAYFKVNLKNPLQDLAAETITIVKKMPITIEVEAGTFCPRYCGVVVANLTVQPSPNWLKTALERLGVRSINNIVDITNYVMLELGQPLHAFDYDKVENHHIVVRRSKKGEKLITLDGRERNLDQDMLVIADARKPIGLAGIMGGANTEVSKSTKTIVLEAANFDAINNRKTSKILNLRTEASTRFEKNLEITLPLPVIKRAVKLLQEISGGKTASEVIDIQSKPFKPKVVKVKSQWINNFIGFDLSSQKMASILKRLGFTVESQDNLLNIKVPSWRQDVSMKADIAEEIARVYGYDKIPITLPQQAKPPKTNVSIYWRRKTKQHLKGLGFIEVLTQPFVGRKLLEKIGALDEDCLQLVNPLTIDQEFMRRSLIPSLLEVTQKNLKHMAKLKIYEIDRVFIPKNKASPDEIVRFAGVVVGDDFLYVKGAIETLLEELEIKRYEFKPAKLSKNSNAKLFQPDNTAEIIVKNTSLGLIGNLKSEVKTRFDIVFPTVIFDLNFDTLIMLATATKTYILVPQFPPLIEDMTFTFPKRTYVGPVIETISSQSKLIKNVKILDTYNNSTTFRITYQSRQKSLSSTDIKDIRKRVGERVAKKFNAKLKAK